MTIETRPISPDEFDEFIEIMSRSFNWDFSDDARERSKRGLEFDRSIGAFIEGQLVGTAGAYSFDLTVPGPRTVPTAGVTIVSVLPTHRRRGVLNAMMRHQLDDIAERGEPIAALWASESIIYGRYGYGMAALHAQWEISQTRTQLAYSFEPSGKVRFVDLDEAKKVLPDLYDGLRSSHPGWVQFPETSWEGLFADDPDRRGGGSANRFVVYEESGSVLGAIRYRVKQDWGQGIGAGTVVVPQLISATPEAYEALWLHIFGVDLVAKVEADFRPPDEPLMWMLADPRRLKLTINDGLWVRIHDVPAALAARSYAIDHSMVIEVIDEFWPDSGGTFRLEGGPDGAECSAVSVEPDLAMDLRSLSAIYLGGSRLTALSAAGRVEGDAQAVRTADAMFRAEREPWCPLIF